MSKSTITDEYFKSNSNLCKSINDEITILNDFLSNCVAIKILTHNKNSTFDINRYHGTCFGSLYYSQFNHFGLKIKKPTKLKSKIIHELCTNSDWSKESNFKVQFSKEDDIIQWVWFFNCDKLPLKFFHNWIVAIRQIWEKPQILNSLQYLIDNNSLSITEKLWLSHYLTIDDAKKISFTPSITHTYINTANLPIFSHKIYNEWLKTPITTTASFVHRSFSGSSQLWESNNLIEHTFKKYLNQNNKKTEIKFLPITTLLKKQNSITYYNKENVVKSYKQFINKMRAEHVSRN